MQIHLLDALPDRASGHERLDTIWMDHIPADGDEIRLDGKTGVVAYAVSKRIWKPARFTELDGYNNASVELLVTKIVPS